MPDLTLTLCVTLTLCAMSATSSPTSRRRASSSAPASKKINKAIGQIDATTQHNAALVEEAAAATAAMQEEATQLAAVMSRFRLAGAPHARDLPAAGRQRFAASRGSQLAIQR